MLQSSQRTFLHIYRDETYVEVSNKFTSSKQACDTTVRRTCVFSPIHKKPFETFCAWLVQTNQPDLSRLRLRHLYSCGKSLTGLSSKRVPPVSWQLLLGVQQETEKMKITQFAGEASSALHEQMVTNCSIGTCIIIYIYIYMQVRSCELLETCARTRCESRLR